MIGENLGKQSENWLQKNGVREKREWLRQKQTFEMACPYIYPPAGRYKDLILQEAYSLPANWDAFPPSLYVHIPYCLSRCNFCNFALDEIAHATTGVGEYLKALDREACRINVVAGGHPIQLSSIYVGGGTPSLLSLRQTEQLFETIRKYFTLIPGAECSFEVNPDTVRGPNRAKMDLLKDLGVNRVSLGVQSLNADILVTLRRLHSVEMVHHAIQGIRDAGIEHLNIDLMYALPLMNCDTWEKTLSDAVELQSDSISLYQLRIAPNSALNRVAQTRMSDVQQQQAMALIYLTEHGYFRSSANQLIRGPEHEQRHYIEVRERLADIIGLGVSAIAGIGPYSFRAPMNLAAYMAADRQQAMVYRGVNMRQKERCTRGAVLGLKSPRGICPATFQVRLGQNPMEVFASTLGELVERGLIYYNDDWIRTTDSGGFFMDEIATLFFQQEDVAAVEQHEVKHLGVYWHE